MLSTILAIIVLATGLWLGLPGIISGGRVVAQRGPEHLMHYPIGVPWFRGKVNTARWVVNTGRLYAGGALLLGAGILTLAWWPDMDRKSRSACEELVPLDAIETLAGAGVLYDGLVDNGHRCELAVRTKEEGALVVKIEVDAPRALIGASLESQRRELERRSMKLRPLPTLGSDAVVAFHPQRAAEDAVFLFMHGGATVRVRLAEAGPTQVRSLSQLFAERRTGGS